MSFGKVDGKISEQYYPAVAYDTDCHSCTI